MKRNLLIIALLLAGFTMFTQKASAQATVNSSNVPVKISLVDIVSITLGGTPQVEFLYDTEAKYKAAQVVTKTGAFTVFSNKKYNVTVKANAAFTPPAGTTNVIPLDVVTVSVVSGSAANGATFAAAPLSLTAQPLITGSNPSLGQAFNIDYTIPAARAEADLLGKVAGDYTTTLVYTLTQQ